MVLVIMTMFRFPRGSIPIHAVILNSQRKQRQVWNNTLFVKTGVVKDFHHGQTVANQQKLFDFGSPNTNSILMNFDGFDHNYGSICIFPYPKFLGT